MDFEYKHYGLVKTCRRQVVFDNSSLVKILPLFYSDVTKFHFFTDAGCLKDFPVEAKLGSKTTSM